MLHVRPTAFILALASLPLAARLAPGRQVLVVDDDGGAGVDHTDVQAAVDAAGEGALILVHGGSYAGFAVIAKGLEVAAAGDGAVEVDGGVSVRQLPITGHVLLRGLSGASADEATLSILNCAGGVVVEQCSFQGAEGEGYYSAPDYHPTGWPAIRVEGASAVLLRCTALGGDGSDYVFAGANGPGAPALLVRNGSAVVHGGAYTGGAGGDVFDKETAWKGGDGGHAIELHDAWLHASGAVLTGGDGGFGGADWDLFPVFACGDGGKGGSGISDKGSWPGSQAFGASALDLSVQPGMGGLGYLGYGSFEPYCSDGEPGQEFDVAELEVLPEAALALSVSGPVPETGTLVLELQGPAGAPALLGVGMEPAAYALPPLVGPALVAPAGLAVVVLGALPAGPLTLSFPLAVDLPPGEALTLYAQAVYVAPGSGAIVAGAAAAAIVLDSAL